jgi:hypothetical protein
VDVPAGWTGPVALDDKPNASPCGGSWAMAGISGSPTLSSTDKPPPQCSCKCDASGMSCSNAAADVFSDSGCTASCGTHNLASGCFVNSASGCNGGATKGVKFKADVSGSCAAQLVMIKPPLNVTTAAVCNPSVQLSACAGAPGVCAPIPAGGLEGICVHQTGDAACPAGFSKRRVVIWGKLNDARDCVSDCKCGPPRCGNTVFYSDQACTAAIGTGGVDVPNASCIKAIGSAGGFKYFPEPGCTSILGNTAPKGEVTQEEPTTVCCSS